MSDPLTIKLSPLMAKQAADLLADVMRLHSDEEVEECNFCDDDPCQWCVEADAVITELREQLLKQ